MPFEIAAGFIFGLGVSFLILTVAKPIGVVGCLLLGRSGRGGGRAGGRLDGTQEWSVGKTSFN